MSRKRVLIVLIAVLVLASTLRLWGLSRGDMLNDEATYAFRAVGLLDYFQWSTQETPLVWFDPGIPSWTKLSFHDHPPLVFWIQHFFIRLFGEDVLSFRLASALFGIGAVLFLFLVARRLFSDTAALFSAALFAASVNHVFISRVGMQESYVIFFMLAGIFFFLKSLDEERYFIHTGIALGLALLTKYTAVVLFPLFGLYLLFFRPRLLLNRKLWLGVFFSFLLLGPVLVYNFELYRAAGHFDFQLSTVFGERPEAWRIAPGKDIGALGQRLRQFIPNLIAGNSWVLLSLFTLSLGGFFFALARAPREAARRHLIFIASIPSLVLLLLLVGPSNRFLTMLTPFMALGAGVFLQACYRKFPARISRAAVGAFVVLLAFEVFYAVNNQLAYYPRGPEPWLASKIRYENYNAGNRELSEWMEKELAGKVPAIVIESEHIFLRRVQAVNVARAEAEGREPYPAAIVLYGNFDQGERMWSFDRLMVYHGWPVIPFGDYLKIIGTNEKDYFSRIGFELLYFVSSVNIVPVPEFLSEVNGVEPVSIRNKKGDEAFRVYKVNLSE